MGLKHKFVSISALLLLLLLQYADAAAFTSSNLTTENTLVRTLLTGYRKDVRPETLNTVSITVGIRQIVTLDEKNRIMTSSVIVSQQWYDPRLTWIPASNAGIEVVMMNVKNLWMADTYIINSADADGYFKFNSEFAYASVQYTGLIYLILPITSIQTRCDLDARNYPFETQTCIIKFTPWSHGLNRIELDVRADNVDLSDYTPHPVWELVSTSVVEADSSDRVPFEDTENREVHIKLNLKRKALFYMINSVFPCLLLNVIALYSFFVPFRNALTMCMVGFLTFAIYSMRISSELPIQSDFLPKITTYFLVSISYNLLIIIWYLYKNHYETKPDNIPTFVEKFGNLLFKVFCWCYPADAAGKKEKSSKVEPQKETAVADKVENKEKEKEECNYCGRCEACEAEYQKEKKKEKRKKEVKKVLEAINYLVFILALVIMFVYQMSVWISSNGK